MEILKLFITKFFKNNLLFQSAQNAFYFILSIFPFLYILMRIFTHIPMPSGNVLKGIEILFPPQALTVIYTTLNSATYTSTSSHSVTYILIALWSSSMLIYSLKSAFFTFYDYTPQKGKIITRILSVALTAFILIAIFLTLIIILIANLTINIITKQLGINYSPVLLSAISLILIIFDIVLLYVILPPIRIKISKAFPGAVATVISLTIFSYGFSYYVKYIADYSRMYGRIGSVITLLLWFYICLITILSGGLLNSILFSKKDTP